MRTGWRAGFKTQTEIDNYKTELLKACVQFKVNSNAMLERGLLEASRESGNGSEFLPSVNKFINWCKPVEHWEHVAMSRTEKRPDRLLSKHIATKETAKAHLAKARLKLNKG